MGEVYALPRAALRSDSLRGHPFAERRDGGGGPDGRGIDHDGQPAGGFSSARRPDVWVTYDDGVTWKAIQRVQSLGDGRFRATLDRRDPLETNGNVGLNTEAWDTAGNRIVQEIIRASDPRARNGFRDFRQPTDLQGFYVRAPVRAPVTHALRVGFVVKVTTAATSVDG